MLANGGVETAADMARCLAETLQPHMIEAATPCAGGCSPMPNPSPNPNQAGALPRGDPATPYDRGCNPMCWRLQPYA